MFWLSRFGLRLFFVFVVDCSHVQDGSDVFVQGSSKEICSGSPSSALQCCFWGLMLLELRWSSSLVCVRSVACSGPGPVALLRQRLYCTSEAPSESIARILQPYNIRVAHKPITTLRRLLITNVKDKDKPKDRRGAVCKIKCCDCQASSIGETGRNQGTRLTENKRVTRNGDVNSHITEHHLQTKHVIDWESATCMTYSTDYYQRLTQKAGLPTVTSGVQTTYWRDQAKLTTREQLENWQFD